MESRLLPLLLLILSQIMPKKSAPYYDRLHQVNAKGRLMRTLLTIILVVLCSVSATGGERVGESTNTQFEQQARSLVQEFVGQLKPQLKQAMAEGGPTQAIEVCAGVAPGIADSLTAQSGWIVKRVSLKSRNASRAIPDAWEQQVLESFDRRQAAGEPSAEIHYGEKVASRYRYMQAQGVEPVCLVCHGQNLSQPVRDALELYYPDDWATGYSLGQLRGAISVSGKL
jgi:hypothetical protein